MKGKIEFCNLKRRQDLVQNDDRFGCDHQFVTVWLTIVLSVFVLDIVENFICGIQ